MPTPWSEDSYYEPDYGDYAYDYGQYEDPYASYDYGPGAGSFYYSDNSEYYTPDYYDDYYLSSESDPGAGSFARAGYGDNTGYVDDYANEIWAPDDSWMGAIGGGLKSLGSQAMGLLKNPQTGQLDLGRILTAGRGLVGAYSDYQNSKEAERRQKEIMDAYREREAERKALAAARATPLRNLGAQYTYYSLPTNFTAQDTANMAYTGGSPFRFFDPVQYRKCGGLVRHYADGGEVPEQVMNGMDMGMDDSMMESDGQSDSIPAKLSEDEYILSADVVSAIGNGSSEAGARKLDEMVRQIRAQARSAPPDELPPPAGGLDALMGGA